jgi:2-desacetyl-2-hydroxyethyl bacteriochlorophyllide A dehydrogenase
MKAITNTGPGRLEMKEWPLPEPSPGQVRVKTAACGICATDLAMIAGWKRTGFPSIPGHEWSGIVDAVGCEVDMKFAGLPCVAENVLSDGGEVGFEHPGGYGEYLLTEACNMYPLPKKFSLTTAVLIEPLAVSVRALKRLRLEDKSAALIFGDGPIGLLMVMLVRNAGVKHICLVGGRPSRLALAEELGAHLTLNYHDAGTDLAGTIKVKLDKEFPNVIEASGSVTAMQASLSAAAETGKILLIGDYGENRADFCWNQLLHRQLEIIGSNASAGAWKDAVKLARSNVLPLDRLITHHLPASRFEEGMEIARTSRDAIKVVLEWA